MTALSRTVRLSVPVLTLALLPAYTQAAPLLGTTGNVLASPFCQAMHCVLLNTKTIKTGTGADVGKANQQEYALTTPEVHLTVVRLKPSSPITMASLEFNGQKGLLNVYAHGGEPFLKPFVRSFAGIGDVASVHDTCLKPLGSAPEHMAGGVLKKTKAFIVFCLATQDAEANPEIGNGVVIGVSLQ